MLRRAIAKSLTTDAGALKNEAVFYRMRDKIKSLVFAAKQNLSQPVLESVAKRMEEELMQDLHTLVQEKNAPNVPQVKEPRCPSLDMQVKEPRSPNLDMEWKVETSQKLREVDRKMEVIQKLQEELAFSKEQRKRDTADILVRKMQEDSHRLNDTIRFMKTAAGWCVVISLANLLVTN